jgi:hypothetical protein
VRAVLRISVNEKKGVILFVWTDGFSADGQKDDAERFEAWLPENVTTKNLSIRTLPRCEKPPFPDK